MPAVSPAEGRPGDRPRPPGPRLPWGRVLAAALCVLVLVAGLLTYLVARHRPQQQSLIRPSGVPASISTSLANLMALSPVQARPAPGFTLTDQHGRTVSLASLRGHAVVLEFMDPHCVDVCPIVSQEFTGAYRDLGRAASRVVFAAVNVNPYHLGVRDVAAYSREHQLTSIPSWHFLTGPLPALRAVWRGYGIQVSAPSRTADIVHTSEVVFIGPVGPERFIAAPMADHTATGKAYLPVGPLAGWGRGIALVASQLVR